MKRLSSISCLVCLCGCKYYTVIIDTKDIFMSTLHDVAGVQRLKSRILMTTHGSTPPTSLF